MTYTDTDIARLPLAEAKEELLVELLATPYDASCSTPHPRHRRVLRVALAGLTAAAVAAVGAAIVVQHHAGTGPGAGPGADSATGPGPSTSEIGEFSAELVAMAERTPRILLDAPGWTVDTVYGFGQDEGTLGFQHGDQYLELNWYPAASYDDYFRDREDDPSITHAATELFGQEARLFTYSDRDHATMLHPDEDSFVELRASGLVEKEYLDLTSRLRQVSVHEFLTAMPAGVVVSGQGAEAARQVLADIPVPPGFVFEASGDAADSYHFGAEVTSQVFCAWTEIYRTGDAAAKEQAVAALESSRDWKVLAEMDDSGDWPEAIWMYADRVTAGDPPTRDELADGLDCTS